MFQSREIGLPQQVLNERSFSATRLFDLVVATAGLIFLSPIMLVAALALWIESGGGPVFFKQRRLGQSGRQFFMYKFRKFHPTASGTGPLTIKNDPRLTRVGNFLETTKINELPQLWNVIRGDMSIVGPRPETLNFADCYAPLYLAVLDHKPGIFGPIQVLFRDESALFPNGSDPDLYYREVLFPLKARIDLAYSPTRTVFSDFGWVVRGVLAVFGWRTSFGSASKLMAACAPVNEQIKGNVRCTLS